MNTVRIDLTIPMDWGEVNVEQLATIAEVTAMKLPREEMLLALFFRLTGSKMEQTSDGILLHHNGMKSRISVSAIADLCDRLDWIIDTTPSQTGNPTQVDPLLSDTLFGDWFHADALMYGYSFDNDIEYVSHALADLGDPRDKLTKIEADTVALWWAGVQNWLRDEYPDVFIGGESAEPYDPLKARQNLMLMLNDSKPQDNERIEQSKLHDVLAALQHKIEMAKEAERRLGS